MKAHPFHSYPHEQGLRLLFWLTGNLRLAFARPSCQTQHTVDGWSVAGLFAGALAPCGPEWTFPGGGGEQGERRGIWDTANGIE